MRWNLTHKRPPFFCRRTGCKITIERETNKDTELVTEHITMEGPEDLKKKNEG